jgi:hypothetical protein
MPLSLLDRQKLTGEILGAIAAELKTPSRGVPVRLTEVSWTSGIVALVVEQGTGLYVRPAAGFHAEVTHRRFLPDRNLFKSQVVGGWPLVPESVTRCPLGHVPGFRVIQGLWSQV